MFYKFPKGGKNDLPFTLEPAAEPAESAAPPELPELHRGDVSPLQQRFQEDVGSSKVCMPPQQQD